MSIRFFAFDTPNGRKISVALEEMALPYEVQVVDIGKGEQFDPAFLAISPNNKIPAIVLMECIPQGLAERICELLTVPTIGIGASPRCSGQVLVIYDVIGLGLVPLPRLAHDFSGAAGGIPGMVGAYIEAVRARRFPAASNCY